MKKLVNLLEATPEKGSGDQENQLSFSETYDLDSDTRTALNIHIGKNLSPESKKHFISLLEQALGTMTIHIRCENYNDDVRSKLVSKREKLRHDLDIDIHSDEESSDTENEEKFLSAVEKINGAIERPVIFKKTADLILLETLQLAKKIKNFALHKNVGIKVVDKGYVLRGDDNESIKEVEQMILDAYNSILPLEKDLKGESQENIDSYIHALRANFKPMCQTFNLKGIHAIDSKTYYKTYKKLAQRIPELQKRLNAKDISKLTHVRFVLSQDEIRNNPNVGKTLKPKIVQNVRPFTYEWTLELNKAPLPYQLEHVHKLAQEFQFLFEHSSKETIPVPKKGELSKTVYVQNFKVSCYFVDDGKDKEKRIKEKATLLEKEIQMYLKPKKFHIFNSAQEKELFTNLIEPELKNKYKSIRCIYVKDALKIEGPSNDASKFFEAMQDEIKKYKNEIFEPEMPDEKYRPVLLGESNVAFLKALFSDMQAIKPKVFFYANSSRGINVSSPSPAKAEAHNIVTIGAFYKDANEFEEAKKILNEAFLGLHVKHMNITMPLKELFQKIETREDKFKKQFKVALNELPGIKDKDRFILEIIGTRDNIEFAEKDLREKMKHYKVGSVFGCTGDCNIF